MGACSKEKAGSPVTKSPATPPTFAAELVHRQYRKPPLVNLTFDVTLSNTSSEPRWFVFPDSLGRSNVPGGGVDSLEAYALSGKPGNAKLGDFMGTGGFEAVRAPAHARLKLHKIVVTARHRGGHVGPIEFDVIVARSILIDGKPAQAWFDADPTLPVSGELSREGLSESHIWRDEVPAVIDEDRRIHVEIPSRPK